MGRWSKYERDYMALKPPPPDESPLTGCVVVVFAVFVIAVSLLLVAASLGGP